MLWFLLFGLEYSPLFGMSFSAHPCVHQSVRAEGGWGLGPFGERIPTYALTFVPSYLISPLPDCVDLYVKVGS
jgi:hypothetical protein